MVIQERRVGHKLQRSGGGCLLAIGKYTPIALNIIMIIQ